jgi:hypothetical protein
MWMTAGGWLAATTTLRAEFLRSPPASRPPVENRKPLQCGGTMPPQIGYIEVCERSNRQSGAQHGQQATSILDIESLSSSSA